MAGLGGLSGLGGLGGLGDGGGIAAGAHLSVRKEIALGPVVNRKVETWQGPFDELLTKAKAYDIGAYVEDADLPDGGSDTQGGAYGYAFVADVKLSRENGNVGRLVVTYAQNRHLVLVSIDNTEVQRPIKTWRADDAVDPPDLAQVREWEAKKDTNYSAYANFTGLSGNTKKLAEMIFNGIENYSVYVPVVTLTGTTFSFPRTDLVRIGGAYAEPKFPYPWPLAHGLTQADITQDLKKSNNEDYTWVLASSRTTPNADGTYQWIIQYQACDSVEEVLFA